MAACDCGRGTVRAGGETDARTRALFFPANERTAREDHDTLPLSSKCESESESAVARHLTRKQPVGSAEEDR